MQLHSVFITYLFLLPQPVCRRKWTPASCQRGTFKSVFVYVCSGGGAPCPCTSLHSVAVAGIPLCPFRSVRPFGTGNNFLMLCKLHREISCLYIILQKDIHQLIEPIQKLKWRSIKQTVIISASDWSSLWCIRCFSRVTPHLQKETFKGHKFCGGDLRPQNPCGSSGLQHSAALRSWAKHYMFLQNSQHRVQNHKSTVLKILYIWNAICSAN